jgi:hypothetical protein
MLATNVFEPANYTVIAGLPRPSRPQALTIVWPTLPVKLGLDAPTGVDAHGFAAKAICGTRRRSSCRQVSRLYERIARRKGHPKAVGALARHPAEATFWILSKQEPYREPKISTGSSRGDKREIPLSSRKLDRGLRLPRRQPSCRS